MPRINEANGLVKMLDSPNHTAIKNQ